MSFSHVQKQPSSSGLMKKAGSTTQGHYQAANVLLISLPATEHSTVVSREGGVGETLGQMRKAGRASLAAQGFVVLLEGLVGV